MPSKEDIKIGTKFQPRGKSCEYTVVDIFTTTNSKGEVVKIEYLCVHTFLGQENRSIEIATTILRGIFSA
jgi:hypothetical protein